MPISDSGKIANDLPAPPFWPGLPGGRKCDFTAALPSLYNTRQRWRGRVGERPIRRATPIARRDNSPGPERGDASAVPGSRG